MKTYNKCCCTCGSDNKSKFYGFEVKAQDGTSLTMDKFQGSVVLVVNSASKCGFTPQYADLQALYAKYHDRGFEILDLPCNQFGEQSPESDSETTQFCQLNYGTTFPQQKKVEVNGENELPLYTWLKAEQGFKGFDKDHKLAGVLDKMLREKDADYDKKSDIKWNFTKFLIDRQGRVVARFEPTASMELVAARIDELLN